MEHNAAPLLETERTILRAHTQDDFGDLSNMWADETVVQYINTESSTKTESWSRLLRYPGHWTLLGFGYWAVEEKHTGTYLGEVGFANHQRDIRPDLTNLPEVGWVLATHAHRRGLATETAKRVLQWGDENFETERTYCLFDPDNNASINVARKLGYKKLDQVNHNGIDTLIMDRFTPSQPNARQNHG